MGKTLAADLINGHLKVGGKSQVLLTLVSRAPPEHPQVLFPKESSDFAALLNRIVAKKTFECIGQIDFSLSIRQKKSQEHC